MKEEMVRRLGMDIESFCLIAGKDGTGLRPNSPKSDQTGSLLAAATRNRTD